MSSAAWRPSKPIAYLLAVLTVWPIVHFILFLAFIAFSFATIATKSGGSDVFPLFQYVFVLQVLTILLMFALTAVYVVHAFKNDQLAPDRRIMWIIVLFLGNILAFPVYWWIYMRPGAAPSAAIA